MSANKPRTTPAPVPRLQTTPAALGRLLDTALGRLAREEAGDALWQLCTGLRSIRSVAGGDWRRLAAECRQHPIREVLHQCPYTFHGFTRPRGYAGDAGLIDYLYRINNGPPGLSGVGRGVLEFATSLMSAQAVRGRRNYLASELEALCTRSTRPEVLSLACGHARELEQCPNRAVANLGRFLAVDHDPTCLEVVSGRQIGAVETRQLSVVDLLGRNPDIGRFDLIYATGLLDYLAAPTARRLVAGLFARLKPCGRLIVANFIPGVIEVGYMEAFMDWWLVYRTPEELGSLADELTADHGVSNELWVEDGGCIAYLEVVKVCRSHRAGPQ